MHIYHLYLFFCELLFMSPIHFSLLKYLLFTCKKAEYIRGIHLSVMCVKNIFFSLILVCFSISKLYFFFHRETSYIYTIQI